MLNLIMNRTYMKIIFTFISLLMLASCSASNTIEIARTETILTQVVATTLPSDTTQEATDALALGDELADQHIFGQANDHYTRARILYRTSNNAHGEMTALLKSGEAYTQQAIYPLAIQQYTAAQALAETVDDVTLQLESIVGLASVAQLDDDFAAATAQFESARQLATASGYPEVAAYAGLAIGQMQADDGAFEAAQANYEEALTAAQASNNPQLAAEIEAAIAYLPTGIYNENLIVNPGNEESLVDRQIPGWQVVEGNGWVRGGEVSVHEGTAYFDAGNEDVFGELCQTVDLTGYAAPIDRQIQQFALSLFVRSYPAQFLTPADAAQVAWHFLATETGLPIDSESTEEYIVTDKWLEINIQLTPPANTRYLQLCLRSIKYGGFDSDGFFDEISLIALPLQ